MVVVVAAAVVAAAVVAAAVVAGEAMAPDTGAVMVASGLAAAGAASMASAGALLACVATGAGALGTAVEVGAELVVVLEPPLPPPQATSVVPNAAIAAIRIAKFWSGRVMANSSELLKGINYCPEGISEGYAKARPHNSKINAAAYNYVQIQQNIVDFFTGIIRLESD